MRLALAGSVLLHLVGASTLSSELHPESARGHGKSIPLSVRLERAPVAPAAAAPAQPNPGLGAVPQQRFRADAELPDRKCCSGPARLLPAAADPTFYAARDLDSLPMPVAPLELARLPGLAPTAPVRLELTIDEHGTVHTISIAGSPAGVSGEEELRAALAATVFVPARKDGRAVKSRIVLGVQ
jgi:hypothetical protein